MGITGKLCRLSNLYYTRSLPKCSLVVEKPLSSRRMFGLEMMHWLTISPLCSVTAQRRSNDTPRVDLHKVRVIIAQSPLSAEQDQRLSPFDLGQGKLDASAIYKLLKAKGAPSDQAADFVWNNATPPRVQLFMWLAIKGIIQCRANLFKKTIVDSPSCASCSYSEETTEGLLFHCSPATQF